MKIADVMTTDVISVAPHTSLKEVAAILIEHRISGVPVVDSAGTLLGVVSEADILYKERRPAERRGALSRVLDPDWPEDSLKLEARTAVEAMTAPARTIEPHRPVAAAAGEMLEQRISRLPVVDAGGALVGIVTRADLVRAFVRSDEALEHEIREDVLGRMLWIDRKALDVSVDRGEVQLAGEVDSREHADVVERLVRQVPGVVTVDAQLSWAG